MDARVAVQIVEINSKVMEEELKKLGLKINHYEGKIKFLKSQLNAIEEACVDLGLKLGNYHSSVPVVANNDTSAKEAEQRTIQSILNQDKTAAGIICQLKACHYQQASKMPVMNDILGIVATLGKVNDHNLSRLLTEYLGMDIMLALVCKTYDGIKGLEKYDKDGVIDKTSGVHGLGHSAGKFLDGRFNVFCLENMRPFSGDVNTDDPQRKLILHRPRLPGGESPPGFLGFAVNMIHLNRAHLSCLTASGHGLRETLFYSLFSHLQVYKTRADILRALPLINDGAISLDGGILRPNGSFFLGNSSSHEVIFSVSLEVSHSPEDIIEMEGKVKLNNWEKERLLEDIKRQEKLLKQVKALYIKQKQELMDYLTQPVATPVHLQPPVKAAQKSHTKKHKGKDAKDDVEANIKDGDAPASSKRRRTDEGGRLDEDRLASTAEGKTTSYFGGHGVSPSPEAVGSPTGSTSLPAEEVPCRADGQDLRAQVPLPDIHTSATPSSPAFGTAAEHVGGRQSTRHPSEDSSVPDPAVRSLWFDDLIVPEHLVSTYRALSEQAYASLVGGRQSTRHPSKDSSVSDPAVPSLQLSDIIVPEHLVSSYRAAAEKINTSPGMAAMDDMLRGLSDEDILNGLQAHTVKSMLLSHDMKLAFIQLEDEAKSLRAAQERAAKARDDALGRLSGLESELVQLKASLKDAEGGRTRAKEELSQLQTWADEEVCRLQAEVAAAKDVQRKAEEASQALRKENARLLNKEKRVAEASWEALGTIRDAMEGLGAKVAISSTLSRSDALGTLRAVRSLAMAFKRATSAFGKHCAQTGWLGCLLALRALGCRHAGQLTDGNLSVPSDWSVFNDECSVFKAASRTLVSKFWLAFGHSFALRFAREGAEQSSRRRARKGLAADANNV